MLLIQIYIIIHLIIFSLVTYLFPLHFFSAFKSNHDNLLNKDEVLL